MGFLRILRLSAIDARLFGEIVVSEICLDETATAANGIAAEDDAVRPHIGDEADGLPTDIETFVELLRDLHCPAGAEAQLPAGFLLQCRCGERRGGIAANRLLLNGGDGELARFDRLLRGIRFGFGLDAQTIKTLTIEMRRPRRERNAFRRVELADDRPVLLWFEGFDFRFALADQSQSNRLHPSRRARARQFPPEHRGQREPD